MTDAFERHWREVTNDSTTFSSRSGHWHVRKESSEQALGPPFDEVAVYVEEGQGKRTEVGRWPLDDLPDDPKDELDLSDTDLELL